MEDLGVERVLIDQGMGHIDGSVSARYAHVTSGMRERLMIGLTEQWEAALDARLVLCPTSPVGVLDDLLRARASLARSPGHRSVFRRPSDSRSGRPNSARRPEPGEVRSRRCPRSG